MKTLTKLLLVGATFYGTQATAIPFTETGDAGELITTAQMLPGDTSVIYGTLNGPEADLFQFIWGGGAFYVNTVGTEDFDSQLFLFAADGTGMWANDDGIAFAGPAYISDADLAQGTYFLGISAFDYDPYSVVGLMFQSYPYEPVYGPDTAGLSALDHWSSDFLDGDGSYTISFQGVTSEGNPIPGTGGSTGGDVTVPEPATLALFCLGLAGIGFSRRKKA